MYLRTNRKCTYAPIENVLRKCTYGCLRFKVKNGSQAIDFSNKNRGAPGQHKSLISLGFWEDIKSV